MGIEFANSQGLNFAENISFEEKIVQIKQWLEQQENYLLVFDNVSDANVLEELLPEEGKLHILITTRNAVDWPRHQMLAVDVMQENEAVELIKNITGYSKKTPKLQELVFTLGYLPLALAQAGAYMRVKSVNIATYLSLYSKYKNDLLSTQPKSVIQKHKPVWVTFDMNLTALEKDCSAAAMTLKQSSWLNHVAIPEILLYEMVQDTMVQDANVKSKDLLWNDIKEEIKRYSLMQIDSVNNHLSMHPLLQDILIAQQTSEQQIAIFRQACKYIDILYIFYKEKNLADKILLSHARSLNQNGKNIKNLPEDLLLAPSCLEYLSLKYGLTKMACAFLKKKEEVYEKHFGKEHFEIANTLSNLGVIYSDLGQLDLAKDYYERALKIETAHFGEENFEIASTLVNLGNVYSDLGQIDVAKDYYERALKIQVLHFGEEYFEIASTLVNLGNVYSVLGQLKLAKDYYERALKIKAAHFGEEHFEIASTLVNLGIVYRNLGQLVLAKDYSERALKIETAHFGEENFEVASTLMNLGVVYSDLGQLDLAKDYSERALKMQAAHFGAEHFKTASALVNVGTVYRKLGQLAIAKDYSERALKMQTAYFGKEHFEIANTLVNLGNVYSDLLQLDLAKDYYERALKIKAAHLGEGHFDIANILVNLGLVYSDLLQLDLAKDYYERALKIQEQFYEVPHINIAITIYLSAKNSIKLKEFSIALDNLHRAQQIYFTFFPDGHPHLNIIEKLINEAQEKYFKIIDQDKGLYQKPQKCLAKFIHTKYANYISDQNGSSITTVSIHNSNFSYFNYFKNKSKTTLFFIGAAIVGAIALGGTYNNGQ